MKIILSIRFLFIAILMAGPSAQAQTYKWVDEKGVTHYGDSIPPEYKDRGNIELSNRGIPIKKNAPAPNAEQRKAMEEEEQKQKEAQYKAAEQKRKDVALLNTYTNEQEIDVTKARNLKQVEVRIKSAQERITEIQGRVIQQQQALKTNAQNPAMVHDLTRSIQDNEKKIKEAEVSIMQNRAEMDALSTRYEAEKARFRELSQPTSHAKSQVQKKSEARVVVDDSLIKTSVGR